MHQIITEPTELNPHSHEEKGFCGAFDQVARQNQGYSGRGRIAPAVWVCTAELAIGRLCGYLG
jgi:hypothetical protein